MYPTPAPRRARTSRAAGSRPTFALVLAALLVLARPGAAPGQTYTSTGSGNFSNIQLWNFGAGPVPSPGSATTLNLQSYGTAGYTATTDLQLTLATLQLNTYATGGSTLGSTLAGALSFAGAAQVQLLGSGPATTISAPVGLGSGATGLTFTGSGGSGVTLSGVISSSTAAGAPITIATTPGAANVGVVTLSGTNTFGGGVVLNSGSLAISSALALGALSNTLTVNGGSLQFSGAATTVVGNNVVLNSTLNYTNTTNNTLTLTGVLSGSGGVNYATAVSNFLNLQGANTYTGATTIGMVPFAGVSGAQAGTIHVQGAVGSVLTTSAITVRDGGTFEVNLNSGNSIANARVSTSTPVGVVNGFLQVVNSASNNGIWTQNFGTVTGSGAATILANANTATGPPTTIVNVANLVRGGSGTFVFTGNAMGTTAPVAGTQVGSIFLGQVNGAAPSAALVGGGGGANTTTVSILPWALGDVSGAGGNFGAGTGLVTYDPTVGVRLLSATTEYNTSNFSFSSPADNMRVTAAATLSADTTVNSVFNTGAFNIQSGLGGPFTLTVTSGAFAQATGTSSTVSANLAFPGEGVVSVIGGLGATNTLTVSGNLTAASLTKASHGTLILTGTNTIAGALTVNGGFVSVPAVSNLGNPTGLTFSMPSFTSNGGLIYSGSGTDTLSVPVVVNSGHAQFNVSSSTGVLNLNSNISGAGGINPQGTGTLVLGGTNTFTGGMRIGSGTTVFDSDARLGDPAGFLTINGGSIRLNGSWTTARTIGLEGSLTLDTNGFGATWGGPVTGAGAVTKQNVGFWTITGANNPYTGTITLGTATLPGGTLVLSGAGDLNSGSVTLGVTGTTGTPTLDISVASGSRALANLNGIGTGLVNLGTNNLLVGAGTYSGVISSAGGSGQGQLIKVGSGTLTLNTSTNTYEGGTQIWGGTLGVDADARLGLSTAPVAILGGAFNNTAAFSTARNFTLGATFFPTTSTIGNTINAGAGLTITGNLTGPGGFQKTGTGTLTLAPTTGGNTYGGDTQITLGTVAFTADNQLGGTASRVLLNAATGTTATLSLAAGAGSVTSGRTVLVVGAGTDTIDVSGTGLTLNGPLLGSGGLTKTGSGTLTLGTSPSYFGTLTVNAGTVALTGNVPRAAVNVTTGTLDLSGLSRELNNISNSAGTTIQLGSGGRLTAGFANGVAMTISGNVLGDAAASFVKLGTGALTITGNGNTFGGGFHVYFGATTLSGSGAVPLQSAFTVGAWGDSQALGTALALDNSTTAVVNRIDPAQNVFFNNSTMNWTGNGATAVTQTINSLRGSGYSTVSMTPGTAGSTLNFADAAAGLTRVNGGTFLFRGAGLGATPGANTATLLFGNLPGTQLVGGGAPVGTASTQVSILPYAVGGTTTTDSGSTFVTYAAPRGIVPLDTATEYTPNLTTATLNDNVRLAPASATTIGVSGIDLTANSLILGQTGGTILITSTSAERLIVQSGAVLNTAANVYAVSPSGYTGAPQGLQIGEIQTGGNTRELNVFATADLAIGAKVTTSGGLTKSGAGLLYLTNAANTYTGGTTVNGGRLVVDSLSALGPSPSLTLGGGNFRYRGPTTTTAMPVTLGGGSANNPGLGGGLDVASGTTLTLSAGAVSGFGGLNKDGTGTLLLTGTNTFSGSPIIAAGNLAIDNPAALGTNTRVLFTSSTAIGATGGAALQFNAPMTLTQDFVHFSGAGTVGFGFDTNGNAVTLSGNISGTVSTRGLYKFGAGNLTLTAAEPYTGATGIYGGTLTLSGPNGSIANSQGSGGFLTTNTVIVNPGAALVLDNAAANNNNRLPNVLGTPFGTGDTATTGSLRLNGGELRLIGNSGGTAENANRIEINIAGTVTLVNNQGGNTALISGRVFRANSSTAALVRGDSLGATPGPTSTNWFAIDLGSGSTQTSGAGGTKGTPFVSILPGFMGDASSNGVGTDLVTYDSAVGVRLLSAAEYAAAVPANGFDPNRAPNLLANAATLTVPATTTINALKLTTGGVVTGPGNLTFTGSTILATGNATLSVPNLNNFSAGVTGPGGGINAGWDVLTAGSGTTLTVSSSFNGSANPLWNKYGTGTVALSGSIYGTGGIVAVSQGTLRLSGASAAINPIGVNLTVLPGATFDLGGSDRTVAALNTTALIGTFNLNQVSDGTVALGGNTLTLYDNVSTAYTGQVTGTGGLTKGFFSASTSTFTQPLAYTGVTRIHNGTLQLGGQGTILGTSQIDVLGGTLQFSNTDDNAAAGGHVNQRVSAATPISLAGTVQFTANANAVANHTLGPTTLVGAGTLSANSGTNAPMTVTISNLARAVNQGALTVTGTNLGLPASPNGNSRIFLTQIDGGSPTAAPRGGGGADGTTTVSILPWAWSSTGSFVTYGANGIRPLSTATEYETNPDAPSSPFSNIRTTAAATLTGNRQINSLIVTSGNVTGAFNLNIGSGALAVTTGAATTVGNTGNTLSFGAGGANNAEGVVFTTASTVLTVPSNITTSAGLTKFGPGTVALTGTNTFGTTTGSALAIHGGVLQFSSDSNLGTPGLPIVFGMPTNAASPTGIGLQYTGTTALTLNRNITTNSFGAVLAPVGVPLIINGNISGKGAFAVNLTVNAGSVYELNGTNTFQGDFFLNFGHVGILSDAAFGNAQTIQINSGTSSDGIDLRADWTTGRTIHMRSAGGINTNGFNATLNGPVIGAAALTKNNNGTLTLTATSPYTGVFSINAGEVRLFNQGAIGSTGSQAVGFGATLTLDDTGTHFPDRLPDTGTVSLNNATFNLRGNASVATEEVIGTLTLAGGQNTVTLTPGTGQSAVLRIGNTATRGAAASALFRGTNLGVNNPGTANSTNVVLVNPLNASGVLVGGGGPAGSTAVSVIFAAFGDTSPTGLGTQLVTYDLARGVRLLSPTEYYNSTAAPLPNGVNVNDNVRLTTTASVNNATAVNALWLDNGGAVGAGLGGGLLTVTSGSILVSPGNGGIAGGVSAGANVLAIGGPGDLTISGVIPAAQTGGLAKLGAGTLTLSAANLYTGTTYLGAGTIAVGTNTSLGTGTLQILSDVGTLTAASPGLTLANTVGLSGTLNVAGTNNLTLSGPVNLQSASRAVNVAAGLTVTMSGVVAGNTTSAGIGLVKSGAGTLVLTGANTYGPSGNSGFYLAQTVVNAGELRINNTTGSGTGGSAVVVNSGGRLSGTGFIVPTQLGTARNTVTVNSGGTLSPGLPVTNASPGTLTVGSSTTPGLTDATVVLGAGSRLAFFQNTTVAPAAAGVNTGGSGTAGTANNVLTVLGNLVVDPAAVFAIAGDYNTFPSHTASYSFQVATATAIPTAVNITNQSQFDTSQFLSYNPGDYVFSLQSAGNALYFNMQLAPVPEPSLVLAVCAGAAAALRLRRRRPGEGLNGTD